jgi:Ion channel
MVVAILISIILVLLTFCLHQATLTLLARLIPMGERSSHLGLYLLMLGVFTLHLVEILLYVPGYYLAADVFDLGYLEGPRSAGLLGHFYASAVFYTSLGLGDVLPNGHLRFIAGVETLNGLLLIAWSASFLFAAMGQFWHCLTGVRTNRYDPEKIGNNQIINEPQKNTKPPAGKINDH